MLLAIETATAEVGVALAAGDEVLAAATVRPGRRHAEVLHPLVADVTRRAGVALAELDAVAVDVGPGLFTGLRVGIAAAKALGFALGVPLVPVLSTDVLLFACRGAASRVVAVVDLRRGELAWSIAEPVGVPGRPDVPGGAGDVPGRPDVPGRSDLPASIAPAQAVPERGTPEVLAALLAGRPGPALLAGDGARRHADRIAALVGGAGGRPPVVAGAELDAPPVASLALLALARLAAGEQVAPGAVVPCYLRDADVRINWATRHDEPPPAGPPPRLRSGLATGRGER